MTTVGGPERPPERGGSPEREPLSLGKALAVVVVALAIGIYLMQLGGGPAVARVAAPSPAASTAPAGSASTPAPTTTVPAATAGAPNAAVKVLVANASQTTGVAAYYTHALATDGWGTLTPTTALTVESTATVDYQPGQEASAAEVASELGLPSSAVAAVSAATPVDLTPAADVVVVVGLNLAAQAPATA